ncbi:SUMF1/EgtB/PvdO family nonheme iron enzyme [Pseudogemmobacter sp. W21_MBD1_M6]|uniref:SUMF1/EgtB/PvdO family nonheme iron enzyme n=1 Tax=Pseudogemmobacter sp. W21_MBD1_M6 TaxID=3240271 RepID=UPI003F94C478
MYRQSVPVFVALVALVAGAVLWLALPTPVALPETVRIAAGPQEYRPAGEFRKGTRVVDAPVQQRTAAVLEIMKYQVSEADYARCATAGACPIVPSAGQSTFPQTNVNHADATAYAAWFSDRTGQHWRLPTDAEWLRAAAERGSDDTFAEEANGDDPSRRWIASYRREVALRGEADLMPHARGHFGVNKLGVADIAGNVWEWTETCFQNGTVTATGNTIGTRSNYCGVRAVQGKHRAFVIDFIRDARSGGCAAGVPPDYLGFRLVRDGAA